MFVYRLPNNINHLIMMKEEWDPGEDEEQEERQALDGFGVQRFRRRTNWQHHADSLRPSHLRLVRELVRFVLTMLSWSLKWVR
jgi:hypothetical protein